MAVSTVLGMKYPNSLEKTSCTYNELSDKAEMINQ